MAARYTPIAGKTIPRIVFWPGSYLPGPDIGDVARLLPGNGLLANHERALLVRPARSEVLLQQIRRDVEDVVAPSRPIALQSPAGQRPVVRLNFRLRMT